MSNERSPLLTRETILVEDWIGPDSDARRAAGEPPDRTYQSEGWYLDSEPITAETGELLRDLYELADQLAGK